MGPVAAAVLWVSQFTGVAAAVAIGNAFIYASATYLLNRAVEALTPKPPKGAGRTLESNYSATDAGAPILLGEVRVGGMEVIPPLTTGNDGRYLHRVHAIAAHECESIEGVYFDDEFFDNSAFNSVTGTDGDGLANSGAGKYQGLAWIRPYLGTNTQNVDYILNQLDSTAFPSTFRGRGITYAAIRYQWNGDVYSSIPNQAYVVRGAIAYDPRIDSSPGNDPANASYQAWTQNPALLLAWYLMNTTIGGGYQSDELDWASFVTAANTCDDTVAVPTASTAPRYTCNGLLLATNEFPENVKILTDAMLGRVIFRDGRWHAHAGQWQTPTFDISKSDWISPLSITFEGGYEKRFARARTWYVDPNRNFQRVQSAPRFNSAYYTADGGEWNDAEFENPLCNNEYEAQRYSEMLLRQSRDQVIITGRLPPRFQDIALWDTGAISDPDLGWSDKTFRCVGINLNSDGSLDGVFQEEQESDWDDLSEGDYNVESTIALPSINPTTPSAPTSLDVGFTNVYGTLLFNIGEPVVRPIGTRYQIIRSNVSTNAAVGTIVYDGDVLRSSVYAPSSSQYYYSRAYVGSYYGPYYPNSAGIAVGPARVQLGQSSASSYSVGNQEITNPGTVTPDANGSLAISAMISGYANNTFDSGTRFSIVCVPTALTTSAVYLTVNPTSAAAINGYRGGNGYFTPNSTTQFVTMNGVFDINSGTDYTFGIQGFKAAGVLLFYEAQLSHLFTRY